MLRIPVVALGYKIDMVVCLGSNVYPPRDYLFTSGESLVNKHCSKHEKAECTIQYLHSLLRVFVKINKCFPRYLLFITEHTN